MAQAIEAEALHQAHGSGIKIGPHRFTAVCLFSAREGFGDFIQGIVPGNWPEFTAALFADSFLRLPQAVRMMYALLIARDLGANDTGGLVIVARAAHLADAPGIEALNFQRAGARTVVRTDCADKFAHTGRHSVLLKLLYQQEILYM